MYAFLFQMYAFPPKCTLFHQSVRLPTKVYAFQPTDSEFLSILALPSHPFIQINQPLTLTCLTKRNPNCYWLKDSTFLTNEISLKFESTNQRSSGLYTCVCSGQWDNHISYVLKVQGWAFFQTSIIYFEEWYWMSDNINQRLFLIITVNL